MTPGDARFHVAELVAIKIWQKRQGRRPTLYFLRFRLCIFNLIYL